MHQRCIYGLGAILAVLAGCGSSSGGTAATPPPAGTSKGGSHSGGTGNSAGNGGSSEAAGGATGGTSGATGGSATGGTGSGETATDACNAYASTACMQLDSCSHWLAASTWPDVPTCTSRVAASCVANLGLNGVTTSPDAIKSCAGVLASATCNDIFGLLIAEQLPPMCGFTPGMLADGSACSSNEQCANLHCTGGGGTGCGKCAPAGTLGGACTTSKDCPFESTCAASVCVTPGAVSGTCDAMHPCSLGLLCTGGMCAMPASEGATCMNMSPDPCDALMGEFCNPKTKVCQKVKYAAAGESCGIVGTDLVQCSGAGQCTGITKMNFTGMCVAAAADGAACDAKAGPFCMAPAGCINGTCQSTFNCQ